MSARRHDDVNAATIARAVAGDRRPAGGSVPRTGKTPEPEERPGARQTNERREAQQGMKRREAQQGSERREAPRAIKRREASQGTQRREDPVMDDRIAADPDASASQKTSRWFRPTVVNVKLIYAGYLASLAMPFLAIIAALFAYQSAKQNPPAWLATHYTYQLRTFWIGLAANLIAWALSFLGVGLLLFPLIAVWLVARSVKGLIRIARQHEIEEPNSYFV